MEKIIILEDDPDYQRMIRASLPQGVPYEIIGTSEALRVKLAQNAETTVFVLDDQVPDKEGGPEGFRFLVNARAVLAAKPDAKIFYTGSMPVSAEKAFCAEHNIQMINRRDIAKALGLDK